MKKKSIHFLLIFCSLSINLIAQDGSISVSNFINITKSSLSSISSTLKENGYSLQFIDEKKDVKNSKWIRWGYRAIYKGNGIWDTPSSGNFSYLNITYSDDRMLSVYFGFNNYNLYKNYLNNLKFYGFIKNRESVDLEENAIIISFINTNENTSIWVHENVDKNDFPYIISWVRIDDKSLDSWINLEDESFNETTKSTSSRVLNAPISNIISSTASVGQTYTNRQKRFSINYPNEWEVSENPNQYVQVTILAPASGTNFRTNYNVSATNRTETVDVLFEMTQRQIANSNAFVGYKLNEKEYVAINGMRGIKTSASYRLNGYVVKGIQYILKKADNTVYSISFTVGESSYQRDKNLIENIIQTFKSF